MQVEPVYNGYFFWLASLLEYSNVLVWCVTFVICLIGIRSSWAVVLFPQSKEFLGKIYRYKLYE